MARGLDELRGALRDEAYHLRVLAREHRNRSTTAARHFDDALERIEAIVHELELPTDDPKPQEAHGYVAGRNARPAAQARQ